MIPASTQTSVRDRLARALETRLRPVADAFERPDVQRLLPVAGRVCAAAILALFAFGMVMVATMLRWWYVAAGVMLLAGWPWLLDRVARRSRLGHVLAITPVALVVPIVALLGVDVVWSSGGLPRPSPALGLAIAGVVVAAVTYVYLSWVGRPAPPHRRLWASYAVVAAVALAAATGQDVPSLSLILTALATGLATWVYLRRAMGPEIEHPLWWALLLVGVAVVAAPLIAQAVQSGRTSAILLIAGAVIAAVAGLNGLWLPHDSQGRRHARRACGVALVFGVALPLLTLAFIRATSMTPAAPQEQSLPVAAMTSPLPRAAVDHRPILLFDSGERFRRPLDVDRMLATGQVQLCPQDDGLLAGCRAVGDVSDLRNGFGNLDFNAQQIEDDDLPTTIYAHAVSDRLRAGWTDIDYWWYLPDNPANTAQGAMCGAGLVIAEITCFDHQSDWEGVTVVVDHAQRPVAVHYAAHNHVIDVPWTALQAAVRRQRLDRYAEGQDVSGRPLVFVARGTHAAYPLPCRSATCDGDTAFEDNRHDGTRPVPEQTCSAAACVNGFPRTAGDTADASWNAFDGRWGTAVCLAGIYCARANAPQSPARQGRYKRPWCYDFAVGTDLRHPRAVKPAFPACLKATHS